MDSYSGTTCRRIYIAAQDLPAVRCDGMANIKQASVQTRNTITRHAVSREDHGLPPFGLDGSCRYITMPEKGVHAVFRRNAIGRKSGRYRHAVSKAQDGGRRVCGAGVIGAEFHLPIACCCVAQCVAIRRQYAVRVAGSCSRRAANHGVPSLDKAGPLQAPSEAVRSGAPSSQRRNQRNVRL
jgi:hypothetical protein